MSLENLELDSNIEVYKPPLEYVTHEEFTMQMEREANRKLKAEIRRRSKLKKIEKELYPSSKVTIEEIKKFYEEYCEIKVIA